MSGAASAIRAGRRRLDRATAADGRRGQGGVSVAGGRRRQGGVPVADTVPEDAIRW